MRNQLAQKSSEAAPVEILEAIRDYRIVSAPLEESTTGIENLEHQVQELIAQGLVPLGAPFTTKGQIHQAMVKSIYLVPTGM